MRAAIRRWVKGLTAGAVQFTGLGGVVRAWQRHRAGGRRVAIISYHRVVPDFAAEVRRSIPGLLTSARTLRAHLEEAHRAGYDFARLEDALEVLAGRKRARRDLMVVTFDDGYRDVYQHAAPLLRQMGVPAIIYLPVGYVGTGRRFVHDRLFHLIGECRRRRLRPAYADLPGPANELLEPIFIGHKSPSRALDDFIEEHPRGVLEALLEGLRRALGGGPELEPEHGEVMGWDEVRTLAAQGFDFGAHTVEHTVLTLEPPERVEREIRTSKEVLERELGRKVADFAYCNGWYSDEVICALVRHGFRSAVTTEDLPNPIGADPYALKRKVLWENFSVGMLGTYSPTLTRCHLDDVFGFFGITQPVLGRRPQRAPVDPGEVA